MMMDLDHHLHKGRGWIYGATGAQGAAGAQISRIQLPGAQGATVLRVHKDLGATGAQGATVRCKVPLEQQGAPSAPGARVLALHVVGWC